MSMTYAADIRELASGAGLAQTEAQRMFGALLDGGEVTVPLIFVPGDATQGSVSGLLSWLQGRGIQDWKIVPPKPAMKHESLKKLTPLSFCRVRIKRFCQLVPSVEV